jgi:hypothetical protein
VEFENNPIDMKVESDSDDQQLVQMEEDKEILLISLFGLLFYLFSPQMLHYTHCP